MIDKYHCYYCNTKNSLKADFCKNCNRQIRQICHACGELHPVSCGDCVTTIAQIKHRADCYGRESIATRPNYNSRENLIIWLPYLTLFIGVGLLLIRWFSILMTPYEGNVGLIGGILAVIGAVAWLSSFSIISHFRVKRAKKEFFKEYPPYAKVLKRYDDFLEKKHTRAEAKKIESMINRDAQRTTTFRVYPVCTFKWFCPGLSVKGSPPESDIDAPAAL